MKKLVLGSVVILLLTTACGPKNTLNVTKGLDAMGQPYTTHTYELSDAGMYQKSVADSDIAKAELLRQQSTDIKEVDISNQSKDAQALLNQQKITSIEKLEPTPYSGAAPTTGMDVAKAAVGTIPTLAGAGVKTAAIIETGKTVRTFAEQEKIKVVGDDNELDITRSDDDQTQVSAAQGQGVVNNAPQNRGGSSDSGDSGETAEAVDNGCSAETPVLFEGTCYSTESAIERGFIEGGSE